MLRVTRIDQLSAHQVERGPVIQLDVVERIGEDLGHPHQSGLHALDEEQVHGAEQQTAEAEEQLREAKRVEAALARQAAE